MPLVPAALLMWLPDRYALLPGEALLVPVPEPAGLPGSVEGSSWMGCSWCQGSMDAAKLVP
jgi:aminoglycoside phosphotransferase (APT) family kinase protein